MKKTILMSLITILLTSFVGCGAQVVEKIDIPKYDPNKKNEQVTDPKTTSNPDDLSEPTFPKATPTTEWTMFRRTP
ncbi:MAG: hypothetical protein HGA95_01895, partial [Caldiserica bacterium]|nr:hypothetical protein [Caldisericota bacterium]